VRPEKAGTSSRKNRPTMTKAESHVAWTASRVHSTVERSNLSQTSLSPFQTSIHSSEVCEVIDHLKPIDKAVRDMTATPPGQRESEFTTSLRIIHFPKRCPSTIQGTFALCRCWFNSIKFSVMNYRKSDRLIYLLKKRVTPTAEQDQGGWRSSCMETQAHLLRKPLSRSEAVCALEPRPVNIHILNPEMETPACMEPIVMSRAQIAEPEACPGSKRFAPRSKRWWRVNQWGPPFKERFSNNTA